MVYVEAMGASGSLHLLATFVEGFLEIVGSDLIYRLKPQAEERGFVDFFCRMLALASPTSLYFSPKNGNPFNFKHPYIDLDTTPLGKAISLLDSTLTTTSADLLQSNSHALSGHALLTLSWKKQTKRHSLPILLSLILP